MIIDMDSYNILLGLDFLIKIGVVVDVEKGLIKDMNHDVDDEEQDETLKLWGIGCQDLEANKRAPSIQNHDKILSDDDTNNNSLDESQEDIKVTREDEQYKLFLKN
jgi:hypothetical protein